MPAGNNSGYSHPKSTHSEAKMKSVEDYTVGWICALPIEQTAANSLLDQIHPEIAIPVEDDNTYILGSIGHHNIVITCLARGKFGTVEAAVATTDMVRTFPSLRIGFAVGIGVGVPSKVKLGDIVVGTPISTYPGVVQWDLGKEKADGTCELSGIMDNPPRVLLKALAKLETQHSLEGTKIPEYLDDVKKRWPRLAPDYFWSESRKDPLNVSETLYWPSTAPVIGRKPEEPHVHYGLIASGNKVIKNDHTRDQIIDMLGGNVLCFETEAAGMIRFPCLVVRGIYDYADSQRNANGDWQEYAAIVAAAFAKELLECVRPAIVEGQSLMRDLVDQLQLVSESITTINHKLDVLKSVEICNWLTPIEFDDQQKTESDVPNIEESSGLLNSPAYKDWLLANNVLFGSRFLKTGERIKVSAIIDNISSQFSDLSRIGIASIHCNLRQRGDQTAQVLLASLLKQLSRSQSPLPVSVRSLYDRHTMKYLPSRPTIDEIFETLQSVSKQYERSFVIIDSFDDGQMAESDGEIFLSKLLALHETCGTNILVTSSGFEQFTIRAYDTDMPPFINMKMIASAEDLPTGTCEEGLVGTIGSKALR